MSTDDSVTSGASGSPEDVIHEDHIFKILRAGDTGDETYSTYSSSATTHRSVSNQEEVTTSRSHSQDQEQGYEYIKTSEM